MHLSASLYGGLIVIHAAFTCIRLALFFYYLVEEAAHAQDVLVVTCNRQKLQSSCNPE